MTDVTASSLSASIRTTLGSRDARKLRHQDRIPGSLQSNDEKDNVNLHFDSAAFHTLRRQHVHLFDLDIDGNVESAVVRELQWDAMGSNVLHVEFKRVTRGVETEAEVELNFVGHPKEGIFNHLIDHITVRTIPSLIPDSIEVKIGELNLGDHLRAADIELPKGISLVSDPTLEVAVLSAPRIEAEEPVEDGEEGADAVV
ncbi:MAG: large subunit ribosomal protein L25 [Planctomycetota bacterium]|jgi:large subunit ribosomal protein L25